MKDRLFKDHVGTIEKQSPSWCQAMDDAIDNAGCSRSREPKPPVFSVWAQSLAKIYGARVLFEGEGVAGLLRMRMDGLDYWVFATGPDRIAYSTTGHQIASAQAEEFRRLLAGIGIVYPGVIPGEEPPNGGVESLPPPDPPSTPELRNVVAELLHRKWSKDIKDVLCLATPSPDGGFSIAVENKVDVLQRSLAKYPELAAQHRQPNLAMADQIIAAVREYDREINERASPFVIEEEPVASPPWKADLLEVLDAASKLVGTALWGKYVPEREQFTRAIRKLKGSLP